MFGPITIPFASAARNAMAGMICSICIGAVSQWCGNQSDLNPASRDTLTCSTNAGICAGTLVSSGYCVLIKSPTFIAWFPFA